MLRALTALLGLSLSLGTPEVEPEPVEAYCAGHPLQEAVLADESRVRTILCGRRTGKTVVLRVEAIRTALRLRDEPDVAVIYITNTLRNGKSQFWRPLQRMLAELGYEYTVNETDLILQIKGGGTIRMASASDRVAVDRLRGSAFALCIVDECSTYPSDLLQALMTEVLEPATLDVGGRIILARTPGPTLSGYWYKKSGPGVAGVHRADLRSNPHLMRSIPEGPERDKAIEQFLAQVRTDNGWTEHSPTYQREWLGLWSQDDDVLVFPLGAANDGAYGEGRHGLPTATDRGVPLSEYDWRFAIGVDVGFTSANAFVVVATHPQLKRAFVLHAEKHSQQLIANMTAVLRRLIKKYSIRVGANMRPPRVVIDSGGMGKQHAEELRLSMGIANVPADKRDKASAIVMLRDAVLAGRLVLVGDGTQPLRSEWQVLQWNAYRDGIADNQEDHATDAALYAYRSLRDHTRTEPEPRPPEGSKAWAQQEADAMEQAAMRAHRKAKQRSAREKKRVGKVV